MERTKKNFCPNPDLTNLKNPGMSAKILPDDPEPDPYKWL